MPKALVLNSQAVHQLVDSYEAPFVIELIDTLLEDSPQLVDQIREGIKDNETEKVRRAAHTLKSHSKTFGLEQLAPLCQRLETLTATTETCDESTLLVAADIEAAYEIAHGALTDIRQELAHG